MEKTVACYVEGTQQMGQTGCGEAGRHRAEDGFELPASGLDVKPSFSACVRAKSLPLSGRARRSHVPLFATLGL